MTRAVATIGAGVAATPVLLALLAAAILTALLPTVISSTPLPGTAAGASARADIPPGYLALYQQAAPDCPGLDWSILAAIGKIETDHGRSPLPGVHTGQNTAGAGGPMQFLQPSFDAVTSRHTLPPGGAIPPSRYNPHDAIHAAAFYLCAYGAPTQLAAAIYAYNHSTAYVTTVLAQAAAYRSTPAR